MKRSVHSQDGRRAQGGFTLVEVIVVLSVVLLLTGIAVPMLSSYLEDGRRARAEAEARVLGAAVMSMYKDVGTYPARNSSGTNNYLYTLYSGPSTLTTNPWAAGHVWATWSLNAARGDRMDNHLLNNQPQGSAAGAYATTGNLRWRGPYAAATPLDPWGRPYVCNILSGYRTDAVNYKRLWVVSAGPNGVFDTNYLATALTDIAGDDIAIMLAQRQ